MKTMDEAMAKAGIPHSQETRYNISKHAIDRAQVRFGIDVDYAREWISSMMKDAEFVSAQQGGRELYENDGVQIVTNPETNDIITLIPTLSTSFLRPALERELRKLEREHTKAVRQLELDQALAMQKYAEMSINRAKARNPQTRRLIEKRMKEVKAVIDGYTTRIGRKKSEFKQQKRAIELIAK